MYAAQHAHITSMQACKPNNAPARGKGHAAVTGLSTKHLLVQALPLRSSCASWEGTRLICMDGGSVHVLTSTDLCARAVCLPVSDRGRRNAHLLKPSFQPVAVCPRLKRSPCPNYVCARRFVKRLCASENASALCRPYGGWAGPLLVQAEHQY